MTLFSGILILSHLLSTDTVSLKHEQRSLTDSVSATRLSPETEIIREEEKSESVLFKNPSEISSKKFSNTQAFRLGIAPVSLFAGSAISWSFRKDVRSFRNRYIPSFSHHYDDYLQYSPALAVFGLNAVGVKGKHNMKRAIVSYALSAGIMGILVNSVKYTAKVERPDGSQANSFPSGHTANSFMNATFMHKEYGQYRDPLYSILGYSISTTTGISRNLNNRHWISDVLAGAGIGILSTELGYFIADKLFKERGLNGDFQQHNLPAVLKPSFLEIHVGAASITNGELTKRSNNIYAQKGINLSLEGAWFFHQYVGIGGEIGFSSFPINTDNFKIDDLDLQDVYKGLYSQSMGTSYVTAGPFFSIPLKNNWFLTSKVNIGIASMAKGNIQLETTPEYENVAGASLPFFKYNAKNTLAWTTGLGIQKRIGKYLGLKGYVSYFNTNNNLNLKILSDIDDQGNIIYEDGGSTHLHFNHISVGLGVTAYLW